MKKSMKIFLGVAGFLALFGICFACLSIYAKKEINKPKFELPETVEEAVSPLPATKEEAFDYVYKLYEGCITADDIELSQHTDVHLTEGEIKAPFSDSDNAVVSRILENAQGNISALYPVTENTLMTKVKDIPKLDFTKADVSEFTAEKGYTDEYGENIDDGIYYISLTVNPSRINTKAMLESETRKSIEKELSSVMSIASLDIVPNSYTVSFRIDYKTDMRTCVEIKRNSTLKAAVDFTDTYKALSDKTAQLEIPYETVQSIDLFHYGLRFTERQMAVQKSDMKALPLDVRVNAETTKDNYKIKFDVSQDGILEIDKDGVMTVIGTQKEPVTVTTVLEYDGHTYTDKLIVYATELEVKTDEPENS